jgi:flagellum-specific peptidoglycan hydrolase FlgJ
MSSPLGTSLRGEGARLRQRVERVLRAPLADDAANSMLRELRRRRDDPAELLDASTLDSVAREVIAARNVAHLDALPPRGHARAFLATLADSASFGDWLHGIPASVTLAQAILESSWGRRAPAFNYFGMKGRGPAGSTPAWVVEWYGGTRVVRATQLRAYATPEQALEDHATVLRYFRAYGAARAVAHDPDAFARALRGSYATDPTYAAKLTGLFDLYGLRNFDVPMSLASEPVTR